MPITVVCHKCGTLATVPDSAAGMQGKCEHCGNVIHVPGGPQKFCSVCHADVSHVKRTKDAAGNYYCVACWIQKENPGASAARGGSQVRENDPVTREESPLAYAALDALPGVPPDTRIFPANARSSANPVADELGSFFYSACAICKADQPVSALLDCDGDRVCAACSARERLGEISYRLKKTIGRTRMLYVCPGCKCGLESALGEAGRVDRCPQCGTSFAVPGKYEKFRAARPTTTPSVESAVPAAAPALAGSAPPLHADARGRAKWVAIGALVGAAVLSLALMVGYLVFRPNTTPAQANPATTQVRVAEATGSDRTGKSLPVSAAAARVAAANGKPVVSPAKADATTAGGSADADSPRALAPARARTLASAAARTRDRAAAAALAIAADREVAAAKASAGTIIANLDSNLQGETSAWRGLNDEIHAATELVGVWAHLTANLNGAHAITPIRTSERNLSAELSDENSAIRAIEENDQAFFELFGVLLRYQGPRSSRLLPEYARIRHSLNSEVALETSAFRVEQEATRANMLALGCLATARGNGESALKIIKKVDAGNAVDDSAIRAATRNARGELEILLRLVRDKDPAKAVAIANRVDAATEGESSSIREHEDYEQGIIAAIKFEIENP